MTAPLYKVFHFVGYFQRQTVAVFWKRADAETFALRHGFEYGPNGCYVAAFKRKAA